MAEAQDSWSQVTLGDNEHLQELFTAMENAAAVNSAALKTFKVGYEAAKVAALATANPVFFALNAFINELDKILADLEKSGFFILNVNSSLVKTRKLNEASFGTFINDGKVEVPAYEDINGEYVGAINGKTVATNPPKGAAFTTDAVYNVSSSVTIFDGTTVPQATDSLGNLVTRRVPKFKKSSDNAKLNKGTGLLELTPSGIINEMVNAFSDEGDTKKVFLDNDGNRVFSESQAGEEEIFDSKGNVVGYKKRFTIIDNKPNFSSSSKVGGIVLIFGATDVTGLANLVFLVKQFFNVKDIDDLFSDLSNLLQPSLIKQRVELVHHYSTNDNDQRVTASKSFSSRIASLNEDETLYVIEVDRDGNVSEDPFVAKVIKSDNVLTPPINVIIDGDQRNINELPYYQEDLTLQPINDGRVPTDGLTLVEARVKDENKTKAAQVDDVEDLKNQRQGANLIDSENETLDSDKDFEPIPPSVSTPIICGISKNTLEEPKGTQPNFYSLQLGELIPQIGDFVKSTRGEINSLRGLIQTAQTGITRLIETLDERVQKIEDISNTIISIQNQIANLKNIGFYSLALDLQTGGTANFISRLQSAENKPPDTLKFSAGTLIVAGTPDDSDDTSIKTSYDTLAGILGL